jgi:hypothetical protein
MSEFDNGMGSTQEETYDFEGDGLPLGDHTFIVTDAEEVAKENGTQHVLEFTSETVPFPIKVREWVQHNTEAAQRIGRGNLKKIATAALGQPRYTLSTIKGAKVQARLMEDKEGFAKLVSWKPAPKEVAAVAI